MMPRPLSPNNEQYQRALAALQAAAYPSEFLGPSLDDLKASNPEISATALKQAAETLKIGARWGSGEQLSKREFTVTLGLTIAERKALLEQEVIRLSREHPAGTQLPTTLALGSAYGFSDGTAKNVLASLVAEGVVVSGGAGFGSGIYLAHPADPARRTQMAEAAEREATPPKQWGYSNPRAVTEALRRVVDQLEVGRPLPKTGLLRSRLETLMNLTAGSLGDGAINLARAQLAEEGLLERGGAKNSPTWKVKAKVAEAPPTAAPTGGPAPALAAVLQLLDDSAHQGLSMYDAAAKAGHSDNIVLQAMAVRQLRDDLEGLVLGTDSRPPEDAADDRLKAYTVAEYLIRRMREGVLDPDGIFPTQAELAKTLGVGPAPAKVALITIGQELGCGAQYRTGYEATVDEIAELVETIDEPASTPREFFQQLTHRITEEFPKGTKLPGVRDMASRLPISKIAIERAVADLKAGDSPTLVTLKGGERGGLFTAVGEPSDAAALFTQSSTVGTTATRDVLPSVSPSRETGYGVGAMTKTFGITAAPLPSSVIAKRYTRR